MSKIPGVILAGGQARRMGGGDKCLLELGGQTLLSRVIDRLSPQTGPLAINANGDSARFSGFSLPVIADTFAGFAGPLAGVLSAMDWAAGLGAGQVVTVAADSPFFPADLVAKLRAALAEGGDIALAANHGHMRHPTFGLWPVDLRDDLQAALEGGTRKVVVWTDQHVTKTAVFAGETDGFFNINTAQDLQDAESMLAARA